ncbi:SigB/SigF/SigG family RNA polymerase sigma factor [Streptomyces sp. NPDC006475]|uniref:SigB/SigF/SigG family RNA polymerase sigma factor n=1 Tax=Streptomyces sp. NPDC006475 TaxID=3155719 RepID=UPI0033A6DEF6
MSSTLAVPATVDLPEPGSLSTTDAKELSAALFERMATLDEGTAEYAYARNTLVELNLSLVKFAATRFRNRAEPMEDIIQVGTIGLIKAINRFDTGRGVEFACFALPTIVGEMKRFFRDTSWAVRVPRRLQELRIDLAKAVDVMEQDLGRRPTTAELAERLDVTEEEIVEGERASNGYVARSLDVPANEDDGTVGTLTRSLGCEDRSYDIVDSLESLKPLIAALDERDRLVLSLRFGDELTQSEIGDRLGLSQMHVSRLLARILAALRAGLLSDEPPAGGPTDPAAPPTDPAT